MSTGTLFIGGRYRSELDNGTPNASGQLWPFAAGTSTFQQTFVDSALTTPNTFVSDGFGGIYLVLDSRGEAPVWLAAAPYKFVEKTAAGVVISTTDNVWSVAGYVASAISAAIAGIPSPDTIPPGVIADYGGAGVPAGWLACNGAEVSRTAYAALFAVIGTTWGAGNGSTTFTLPDGRGRVPVGAGGAVTADLGNTIGAVGGAVAHTLTVAEMPSHAHPGSSAADSGHTHSYWSDHGFGTPNGGQANANSNTGLLESTGTGSAAITLTIATQGGGAAFSVLQPSLVVARIIKT